MNNESNPVGEMLQPLRLTAHNDSKQSLMKLNRNLLSAPEVEFDPAQFRRDLKKLEDNNIQEFDPELKKVRD